MVRFPSASGLPPRPPKVTSRLKRRVNTLAATLAAMALVAGCSSGTAGASQANTVPSTAATAAAATPPAPSPSALTADLIGSWAVTLDAADAATIAGHAPGFDQAGTWTMKLSATGFQLFNPENYSPGPVPAGIDGAGDLVIANDPECPGQVRESGGAYTYQAAAASLTFTPVRDDACAFRQWLLQAKPWTKG